MLYSAFFTLYFLCSPSIPILDILQSHAMCADPMTASAARSCCDSDKVATFNHKLEFHGERVSFATNEAQCISDGLSVCDPSQIIAEEPSVSIVGLVRFSFTQCSCTYFRYFFISDDFNGILQLWISIYQHFLLDRCCLYAIHQGQK